MVVYLVAAPVVLLVVASLKSQQDILPTEGAPLSLANYAHLYLSSATYSLLGNTLIFAVGSLLIGLSIAIAFSWLVERTNMPLKRTVFVAIMVPLAIPGVLEALAWVLLLDPDVGLFNILLRHAFGLHGPGPLNAYTLYSMVLVQSLRIVPTAMLMLSGSFRTMDPDLEDASRVCGKSVLGTLRRITLPIARPALLAAFIYFAVFTMESFEVPGILGMTGGIQVFATRIYTAAHPLQGLPDYGTASTLAFLLVVIAGVLIFMHGRLTRQAHRFATVSGKGYRSSAIDIGRWRYAGVGAVAIYFALAVLFPIFIIAWASLHQFYSPPSIAGLKSANLGAFRQILGDVAFRQAIVNTLIVAVATATVTMALVAVISWTVVRSRARGRSVLDFVVFLPQALPTLVIGLAILILYLSFPNKIYGTIWIIAIALTTKYIAFGSRTMNAGMIQVNNELEEASQVCGASWGRTYRRILLPLLLPVVMNGWIWVSIHSMRELSAPLMLGTPGNTVLSTVLWSDYTNGYLPGAAVTGLVLIAAVVFFAGIGRVVIPWLAHR